MAGNDQKNKNAGHRKRLRSRFESQGLEKFKAHEVLELLLFNVIPRANTNEIAHDLINRFGSFSAVLDANIYKLMKVKGIGEQAAFFINSLAPLSRYYHHDKITRKKPILNTAEKVVRYLSALIDTKEVEVFYVLCLNSKCGLIHPVALSEGVVNETAVYPRKVVEIALTHHASSIIIAHNHPSGDAKPSLADNRLTENLIKLMDLIHIPILDHIIIAGSNHYSYKQSSNLF